ncbi:hypothetical protein QNE54_000960 [Vibrio fluvialis]|nr:hypothetical protein [Vibrio fluvialis]
MAVFGLACEGPSDQITLEHMLLGVFEELNDDDIAHVQPMFDKSDDPSKRKPGSWERLLEYLTTTRFKDDVAVHDFLIVHIDTDIARHVNANIKVDDEHGNRLADVDIVNNTIARLIAQINRSEDGYFESIKDKIIFAIMINKLECWLLNTFIDDDQNVCKHDRCNDDLKECLERVGGFPRLGKRTKIFDRISRVYFEQPELIDVLARRDVSFNMFVTRLKEAEIS